MKALGTQSLPQMSWESRLVSQRGFGVFAGELH
jgi:hypothetical protein